MLYFLQYMDVGLGIWNAMSVILTKDAGGVYAYQTYRHI